MFLTNNSENGDNGKSDPFQPETRPYVDPVLPTLAFAAGVLRITFTEVHYPTFTFYGILPASIFAETLPIFTFIGIHCFFLDRFECCYFLGLFLIHFQDWSVFCRGSAIFVLILEDGGFFISEQAGSVSHLWICTV